MMAEFDSAAVVVVVVVWLQAVTGAGAPGNTAAPDAVPLIGQKVGGTAYQKCACGWLLLLRTPSKNAPEFPGHFDTGDMLHPTHGPDPGTTPDAGSDHSSV